MTPRAWPISHVRSSRSFGASILIFVALLLSSQFALAQFTQQGPKLVATDAVGSAGQGLSVALSADGNTAIVGGPGDDSGVGAAWVYTRSGGIWSQQAKLVGTGAVGNAGQGGGAVALSADGNTAIVSGEGDNSTTGAAWVFARSGGVWTQQGNKLVGTGAVGNGTVGAEQGTSVALSGDGNTLIVGGPIDNSDTGAVWIFTRSGGVWTQQGNKLVGTGAGGNALQGQAVALSGDGNTAIVGGPNDNSGTGAAWVYTRSGGVWTQQGNKLVGTGAVGNGTVGAEQGTSVALSGDGNTLIVGGLSTIHTLGRHGSSPAAVVFGPSRATSWSARARVEMPCKARPSRCPATATPPLLLDLTTTAAIPAQGRHGSTLAAMVSGPSKVPN
jgi:hypothetical protein